ncbi:MAG: PAS domain S-box protein [Bacteroidota bacterium]
MMSNGITAPRFPSTLVAVFTLLVACIIVAGYLYYEQHRRLGRRLAEDELDAVADLTLQQVNTWRSERMSDARFVAANREIAAELARLRSRRLAVQTPVPPPEWMVSMFNNRHYAGIAAIDSSGIPITGLPSTPSVVRPRLRALIRQAISGREVVFSDIQSGPEENLHLDIAVPVGASAVLLRIDPATFLYPLLQWWPLPAKTSETILFRVERDSVVSISPVRHVAVPPLQLRFPLSDTVYPAAAAGRGADGIVMGRDYRGHEVLASLRRVAGSSWLLVSKVDTEEILAANIERGWLVSGLILGLILASGATVITVWRKRELDHYRRGLQAEAERKALIRHFEYLTKHANDIILLADEGRRVVECNDTALAAYGFSREEIIGMHIRDFRDPADLAGFDLSMAELDARGSLNLETRHRRKDGSTFPVEISIRIIVVDGRKYQQAIIRDISERKSAEESIRRLNRVYSLISNVNQAILRTRDRGVLFRETCRIAVTDGGFLMAWIGSADPETGDVVPIASDGRVDGYLDTVRISVRDVPEGRGPTGVAFRERRHVVCNNTLLDPAMAPWREAQAERKYRASATFPIMVRGVAAYALSLYADVPGFFDSDEIRLLDQLALDLAYALEFLDVEQEKDHAVAQLRRSEEKYRTFFWDDLTGDFVSTPEGKILDCNPAFARIFGYASTEQAMAVGAQVLYLDPDARRGFVERLSKEKRIEYLEEELLRSDGTPVYTIGTMVGIFDDDGRLAGIRGYLFDDTRRKTLEQQLRQAQKMESLGTLAGGIAHDFNNILGIILGHISFLEAGKSAPALLTNSFEAITRAAQRGAGLVRQILTFARKTDVALAPLSMNDAVEELAKMLRETFPKNIEIVLDLQKDLPAVTMDHTQLHQALLNLCVNARDAIVDPSAPTARKGRIVIATCAAAGTELRQRLPEASAAQYIGIKVADSGSGMDERTKRRLFEPFFTTKAQGRGTGLGLSVVYGVVHAHDGEIEVESQLGKGTTFSLWFPRSLEIPRAMPEDTPQPPAVRGGSETLLFVEDEESLLSMMKLVLEEKGYTVLEARDGMEAVRLFTEHRDDIRLVVTDVGLPKMDGVAVYTTLREFDPSCRIIMASGYVDPEIRARVAGARDSDFIQKPYVPTEMLRKIREILDRG